MVNCKCCSKPNKPLKVKGLRDGFVVKCTNTQCPAKSQRISKQASMDAWDKLATED